MPNKWCGWLAVALVTGCGERSRLTFEDGGGPDDTTPPVAFIDAPAADTVLQDGPQFVVDARVGDDVGVDTVYVDLEGADHQLLPFSAGGTDTVRIGIPIITVGQHGRIITVQVFGVDLAGNRGARVIRKLTIE
jgi:hypothetical protein